MQKTCVFVIVAAATGRGVDACSYQSDYLTVQKRSHLELRRCARARAPWPQRALIFAASAASARSEQTGHWNTSRVAGAIIVCRWDVAGQPAADTGERQPYPAAGFSITGQPFTQFRTEYRVI
jgi:hypothetical protein